MLVQVQLLASYLFLCTAKRATSTFTLFRSFITPGADAENNPAAIGTAGEAWSLVTSSRLQYAGVAQMVEHRINNPVWHSASAITCKLAQMVQVQILPPAQYRE